MRYIDWKEYVTLIEKLNKDISDLTIDGVIGIGRGGCILGGILAHKKGVPLYPVFVKHQGFTEDTPVVPEDIEKLKTLKNGTFLIVDDLLVTGKAMNFIKKHISSNITVKTLVIICHKSAAETPDYIGIVINDLPVFPYEI
jgi:hypoxanthine phosphoribosyltransferase